MDIDPYLLVERLAEHQGGIFLKPQAVASGVPPRTIDRRVAAGRWVPVGLDVLRLSGVPMTESLRLRAATMSLRGSVVAHESAARHHDFSYIVGPPLTVAVPVRSTRRFPGVKVRELTDIRRCDIELVDGVPYTTPARTIVDLAAIFRVDRLDRIVRDALAAGTLDLGELVETHADLARRGKPGVAALRKILEEVGPGLTVSSSVLERRFAALVAGSGLPMPEPQHRPPWWDGRRGVVDYAYPEARLIVELDGRRWHTRDETYDDDRRRDNAAQLAGWRVLRFTWDDIVKRPDYVLATLAAALAAVA